MHDNNNTTPTKPNEVSIFRILRKDTLTSTTKLVNILIGTPPTMLEMSEVDPERLSLSPHEGRYTYEAVEILSRHYKGEVVRPPEQAEPVVVGEFTLKSAAYRSRSQQQVEAYHLGGYTPNQLRLELVTRIASVCYKSEDKSAGSQSLYNKLIKESLALPSTSFEFIPVALILKEYKVLESINESGELLNVSLYGYALGDYWITNLRALLADIKLSKIRTTDGFLEEQLDRPLPQDILPLFHFNFVTMYTLSQLVRHRRCSLQVMSRRYTNPNRQPFGYSVHQFNQDDMCMSKVEELIIQAEDVFTSLRKDGYPQEVARGVLPQLTTTELWWTPTTPSAYQNFLLLRYSGKAQKEIRDLAEAIIKTHKQLKKEI